MKKIGFMQGTLLASRGRQIQAFPWDHWREEFRLAERHGFPLMEWTLDQDRLDENPLMTAAGQKEIRRLSKAHALRVGAITLDCLMQAPFHKANDARREELLGDLERILASCAGVGIFRIVVPLVDDGRVENLEQERALEEGLARILPYLRRRGLAILFESDLPPEALAKWIARYPADAFGINYDIGNSAALGYDPVKEIAAYGSHPGRPCKDGRAAVRPFRWARETRICRAWSRAS